MSLNWIGLIDDAYIFFRYARNISQGLGYVFNSGDPVEGTTSLTWTLLIVLSNLINISGEVAVKILGSLCMLGILILLGVECYRKNIKVQILLISSALLILNITQVATLAER
jgi:hypothetical protein